MTVMVAIHEPEFVSAGDDEPAQITVILEDKVGGFHRLTLEGRALAEFATFFRAVQEKFPGAVGVQ